MAITASEKAALEALQTEISKSFRIKDMRLFGSKASGVDTALSDMDVMIVLDNFSPQIESKIDDLIFDLNLKYDCLISALYFDSAELDNGPLSESPVYKKILAEGVKL
jgi:predicted nucleotidyltransferase